jgi:hypothetical protein
MSNHPNQAKGKQGQMPKAKSQKPIHSANCAPIKFGNNILGKMTGLAAGRGLIVFSAVLLDGSF